MKLETSDIVEEVEPADYGSFNEEISSDVKELHETLRNPLMISIKIIKLR